jgi:hypothetical protein
MNIFNVNNIPVVVCFVSKVTQGTQSVFKAFSQINTDLLNRHRCKKINLFIIEVEVVAVVVVVVVIVVAIDVFVLCYGL